MQILGGSYGMQILYNEFAYLSKQLCCDPIHIGGIQLYGGPHAHMKGNYFHDNGTSAGGVNMGDGDNATVEDNVWVCTCIYPWSIQAAATRDTTVRHNTFAGGGGIHFVPAWISSQNIIRDNVFTIPPTASPTVGRKLGNARPQPECRRAWPRQPERQARLRRR